MRIGLHMARCLAAILALALLLSACGGDTEVLEFPGPTPTPTIRSQG